jgi:hypothetical protein
MTPNLGSYSIHPIPLCALENFPRSQRHWMLRVSLAEAEASGIFLRFSESLLKQLAISNDRSMPIPVTEKPEDLNIIVAGGTGNGTSTLVAGMRRKVTAEIDKYKPENWQQLLDTARKDLFY